MILALILATIDQISSPEESIVDDRPILTPLSFRHFPSLQCKTARKRFFCGRSDETPVQTPRVPSLVEILLHHRQTIPDTSIPDITTPSGLKRHQKRLDITTHVEQTHLGELLKKNTPFYHHYLGEPATNERSQRKNNNPGPRTIYLTSATLIIVPANLVNQWDREIHKHCHYALRVLILRSETEMPHVIKLASAYDVSHIYLPSPRLPYLSILYRSFL